MVAKKKKQNKTKKDALRHSIEIILFLFLQ